MWSFQHVSSHNFNTLLHLRDVAKFLTENPRLSEKMSTYIIIAFNGFIHVCLKYYYYYYFWNGFLLLFISFIQKSSKMCTTNKTHYSIMKAGASGTLATLVLSQQPFLNIVTILIPSQLPFLDIQIFFI